MNHYIYRILKDHLNHISTELTSSKVSNRELFERVKNVSDISVNVFTLDVNGFYDKTEQDIYTDSKVWIVGKINDDGFDFAFSARTPKKEITITWLLKQIQNEYLKGRKRYFQFKREAYNDTEEKQKLQTIFKFKLTYSWYYVTEYGIGTEVLFLSNAFEKQLRNDMSEFLKKEGVPYTNEYSNAQWVLRFLISREYQYHNTLLEKFKKQTLTQPQIQ